MSTPTADLTGRRPSIHDAHFPAVSGAFARHHRSEHSPSLSTDCSSKAVVLDHARDVQIFKTDDGMFPHETGRELLQEVTASVADLCMELCDAQLSATTTVRSFLASRQLALRFANSLFQPGIVRGCYDFASAQSSKRLDAEVDTDGATAAVGDVDFLDGERHVVATRRVERDRRGLRVGREIATPHDLDLPDLGEVELAVAKLEPAPSELGGLSPMLALESWEAGAWPFALQSLEEAPEGSIKIPYRLLKRHARYIRKPLPLRRLLRRREKATCCREPRIFRAFDLRSSQRIVPNDTRASKRPSKRGALLWRWVEAVAIAKAGHWSAEEYNAAMEKSQGFDRGRHSVTKLVTHLVFVTKYRRKVIDAESVVTLEDAMRRVASEMSLDIVELNSEADHLHVVVRYPPKLSISKIVNALKGVSSRRYRQGGHPMPSSKSLWTPSYFAASVGGAPIAVLRQYVQDQTAGLKAGVSDPGDF